MLPWEFCPAFPCGFSLWVFPVGFPCPQGSPGSRGLRDPGGKSRSGLAAGDLGGARGTRDTRPSLCCVPGDGGRRFPASGMAKARLECLVQGHSRSLGRPSPLWHSRLSLIPARRKEAGIGFWGGIWEGRGRELPFSRGLHGPGCAGSPGWGGSAAAPSPLPAVPASLLLPRAQLSVFSPQTLPGQEGGRPLWLQEIPSGSHVTPSHHPGALLLLLQLAAPTLHFFFNF